MNRILMIANPGAGAVALAWMIGAYSIVFGLLLIALGVRLKKVRGHAQHSTSHLV